MEQAASQFAAHLSVVAHLVEDDVEHADMPDVALDGTDPDPVADLKSLDHPMTKWPTKLAMYFCSASEAPRQ